MLDLKLDGSLRRIDELHRLTVGSPVQARAAMLTHTDTRTHTGTEDEIRRAKKNKNHPSTSGTEHQITGE
jgi:hypothetical protein